MYKILLPINKKSDIQGLWHNDGLLYKDNLRAYYIFNTSCYNLHRIAKKYKQIAIFLYSNNTALLYDTVTKNKTLLKNKALLLYDTFYGLKNQIKNLIKKYNGVTIFKSKGHYRLLCYF
jgi:hypothetical protein